MAEETQATQEEISEADIMELAQKMKDNAPIPDERQNAHTFLTHVIEANQIESMMKTANLRDDKEMNELGYPQWTVRGALEMAQISDSLMDNEFFRDFFLKSAMNTLGTSLSREGFIVRQATTQTKQVADVTKRRKINKGWFGKQKVEESGGDTTGASS